MATISRSEIATRQPVWYILRPTSRKTGSIERQLKEIANAPGAVCMLETLNGHQAYINDNADIEVYQVFMSYLWEVGISLRKKTVIQLLMMDPTDIRIATNLSEKVTAGPTTDGSATNGGYSDTEIASARVAFMPKANLSAEFINAMFNRECNAVNTSCNPSETVNRFTLGHTMVQYYIPELYVELYALGSVKLGHIWYSFCLPL